MNSRHPLSIFNSLHARHFSFLNLFHYLYADYLPILLFCISMWLSAPFALSSFHPPESFTPTCSSFTCSNRALSCSSFTCLNRALSCPLIPFIFQRSCRLFHYLICSTRPSYPIYLFTLLFTLLLSSSSLPCFFILCALNAS